MCCTLTGRSWLYLDKVWKWPSLYGPALNAGWLFQSSLAGRTSSSIALLYPITSGCALHPECMTVSANWSSVTSPAGCTAASVGILTEHSIVAVGVYHQQHSAGWWTQAWQLLLPHCCLPGAACMSGNSPCILLAGNCLQTGQQGSYTCLQPRFDRLRVACWLDCLHVLDRHVGRTTLQVVSGCFASCGTVQHNLGCFLSVGMVGPICSMKPLLHESWQGGCLP